MNFSLNEVEATAKRAARGAGYSWGLAEEAGKAARWLCANGQDGVGELTQLLCLGLSAAPEQHAPQGLTDIQASGHVLCPLAAGALLSDCAGFLTDQAIEMKQVAHPMLLLPFAANASRARKARVMMNCDGAVAVTDGIYLSCDQVFPAEAQVIQVILGGELSDTPARLSRATPDTELWVELNRFAHRTYAPATEESRKLGAGAGLSDND